MRWLAATTICFLFGAAYIFQQPSPQTLLKRTFESGQLAAAAAADIKNQSKEIYFTGDVLLARDVEQYLLNEGSDYPYRYFSELFEPNSYIVGNFEAAVPYIHTPTPDLTTNFSVAATHLPAMADAGFTHFSLANNHSFDKGDLAYLNTRTLLEGLGMQVIGHPKKPFFTTSYITIADKKIALLALDAVQQTYDNNDLSEKLIAIEEQSDLQIVFIHWGIEYQSEHTNDQSALAHYLIDNGVDLIIGHHPHVVQDIEVYKNQVIVYSLGNFIFDQYFSKAVQTGLVLELASGEKWTLNLKPVSSLENRAQPRPMASTSKQIFLDKMALDSDEVLRKSIATGTIMLDQMLAISPQVE